MRVRTVLIVTAILSSILGAVIAYLVLTVPNDLQAAALMRSARKQIAGGDNERARQSLSRIVQQYPRTDAAAAATVALASLADSERKRLETDLSSVRNTAAAQQKQIVSLTQRVDELAARPLPQPAPPPQPKPEKNAKKAAPKRKTSHRRR